MGRRLGRSYSRTLREGMAGGRNRPREPSGPGLCRALRRPFGAPGSADAIAGSARQRPLGTVGRRSLPDLRLPGHRKPLTRACRAATRPPPKPSQKSCPFLLNRIALVLRVIHTIHQTMTHHRSYQIRYTGESRCPRQKWIPAPCSLPGAGFAGKARRGRRGASTERICALDSSVLGLALPARMRPSNPVAQRAMPGAPAGTS